MSKFLNPFVQTLDQATNTYKYYWVLGILNHIIVYDRQVILIEDVLLEMLVEAWHTIRRFKLYFGFYDKLPGLIGAIQQELLIDDRIKKHDLRKLLYENRDAESIQAAFTLLTNYVPYRFLSSWFAGRLVKLNDSQRHKLTAQLARQSEEVFYCFSDDGTTIIVRENWIKYIKENNPLVRSFAFAKLNFYLQKRNPNVPAILSKIQGVDKRNHSKAKSLWSLYLAREPMICIYSGEPIQASDFSLDHFIPWSFVAHDESWNMIPTPKHINSSKSDQLPAEVYLEKFIRAQYDLFHVINNASENSEKQLIDYINIFKMELIAIAKLDFSEFSAKFKDTVSPMFQVAKNMGFRADWKYGDSFAVVG